MSTASNPAAGLARPVYPPLAPTASSQNSSAYQSYSSTSLATPSSASSAPMPSPSAAHSQQHGFFGAFGAPQPAQQQQQQQQQQTEPLQRHPTFEYHPNRDGAGRTATETNQFLNQAALLAEAAKRAQMAVVMRDLDGMEL